MIQFYAIQELYKLYPDKKIFEIEENKSRLRMFDQVCGSKQIRERFGKRYRVEDILDYWNKDVDSFRAASKKYWLYPATPATKPCKSEKDCCKSKTTK